MAKSKKHIGDKFGETRITLPPDQFIYQEDDVILLGCEMGAGGTGKMTPRIISTGIFLPESLQNIRLWLEQFGLQTDDVLANRVQSLAGVISIDSNKRQALFARFRETQIAKLDKCIESIQTAMHKIWSDGLYLDEPYGLLQKREQLFTKYRRQLKSQHTDVHKLLYRELYPVLLHFDDLKIIMEDQNRMLLELFKLFKYEDFEQEVKDTSMINRAKKINYSTRKWFSNP